MRIAGIEHNSIVDGPGLRFVVFVQGCSHKCPDCHNPGTHDPSCGYDTSVAELLTMLQHNVITKGLTISGGEPFEQALECAMLAEAAHKIGLNVWTYTGYTFEQIAINTDSAWQRLLQATDVLVDGPFVASKKSYDAKFRGSTNQRLILVRESLECGSAVLWEPTESPITFATPES